jgi:hypothetical protein
VVVEEGVEEPSMVSFNSSLLYFDESATWWVFFLKHLNISSALISRSQCYFVSLLFWPICSRVESRWNSKSHWNSTTQYNSNSNPYSGILNLFFVKGARGFGRCWMPRQEDGRWCRTVNESRLCCSLCLSPLPW